MVDFSVTMKPTLVLVHGMFCDASVGDEFRSWFEAQGYRCVTPTLRHHDKPTPAALADTSVNDYVAALETVTDSLAGPLVLVGHSMGG